VARHRAAESEYQGELERTLCVVVRKSCTGEVRQSRNLQIRIALAFEVRKSLIDYRGHNFGTGDRCGTDRNHIAPCLSDQDSSVPLVAKDISLLTELNSLPCIPF